MDSMRFHGPTLLMSIFALLLAGCSSAGLTTQRAQRAIDQWASGPRGTFTVQGVKELPQQNAAQADITVSNFVYTQQFIGEKHYTGPAIASFSHYSDGRWVLTNIALTNEFLVSWNTNIEVK